jgi:hypothetical protein
MRVFTRTRGVSCFLALACALLLAAPRSPAAQVVGSSTATGVSRHMNPALSVNGLFLGAYFSREPAPGGEEEGHRHGISSTGLHAQELELQLTAAIDPFTRGDMILALPRGEGVELEEGVVTLLSPPANLGLRFGKFYAPFGRHNRLHTHQYPFVDPPRVNREMLGGEGLNDVGLEVSYLLPLPWYGEINLDVFDGDRMEPFGGADKKDLAYVGHLGQLWDLTESTTLELGGSYAGGKNPTGHATALAGADLTVRWIPLARRYRAVTWQSEVIHSSFDLGAEEEDRTGAYSLLQYRFARRWWIQARYDWLEEGPDPEQLFEEAGVGAPEEEFRRSSALLAFVPSEFSALRLQVSALEIQGDTEFEVFLQFNFTMGSHPAHRY